MLVRDSLMSLAAAPQAVKCPSSIHLRPLLVGLRCRRRIEQRIDIEENDIKRRGAIVGARIVSLLVHHRAQFAKQEERLRAD